MSNRTQEQQIAELEQKIADLSSELSASLEREEQLIKERGKIPLLVYLYNDPSSKFGKILRLPRTTYRIIRRPSTIQEIIKRHSSKNPSEKKIKTPPLLAPVQFISVSAQTNRINLLVKNLTSNLNLLKTAVTLANQTDQELRIVTFGESVSPLTFKQLLKQEQLKTPKHLSFYSSLDESKRSNPYRLEVSSGDVFLTAAWGKNEI